MQKYIYNEEILKLPLDQILLENGYMIKRNKTSKNNIALQNIDNGEILIITRQSNEHYLYFNTDNSNDKGNIFSFCKNRNININDLLHNKLEIKNLTHTIETNNNKTESIKKSIDTFKKLDTINLNQNYFITKRLIDKNSIKDFENQIKTDKYGNLYIKSFILQDNLLTQSGYVSYLNNPIQKTKDSKIKQICNGKKGLEILKFQCKSINDIKKLIISESTIDSLSLFEMLDKTNNTLICSTNGTITESQKEIFKYFNEIKGLKVILAFDRDEKGSKNLELVNNIFNKTENIKLIPKFKDFNDDLFIAKALNLPFSYEIYEVKERLNLLNKPIKEFNDTNNYIPSKEDELKEKLLFNVKSLEILIPKVSFRIKCDKYMQDIDRFLEKAGKQCLAK